MTNRPDIKLAAFNPTFRDAMKMADTIDFDRYRDMSDEEFLALLAKEGVDLGKVAARTQQDMDKLFQAYPEAQD